MYIIKYSVSNNFYVRILTAKTMGRSPTKAVIFDMGGVIIPGPFKVFRGNINT